ncbi:hypothetical protein TNCV_3100111 [Trichonephila clavipes]|nr:hypothetical protein TNCV_3100111 [Trichonephila clavipes]
MENGFKLGDFRKMKRYDQKVYKLPPPIPAHVPAETNKRPWNNSQGLLQTEQRVYHTHSRSTRADTSLSTTRDADHQISPVPTSPPVQIPDPPNRADDTTCADFTCADDTTCAALLPDPPPVQILLPDPPPVVQTLSRPYGRLLQ